MLTTQRLVWCAVVYAAALSVCLSLREVCAGIWLQQMQQGGSHRRHKVRKRVLLLPLVVLCADSRCALQSTGPHCRAGRFLRLASSCVAVVLLTLLVPSHQAAAAAAARRRHFYCLAVLCMLL